MADARIGKRCQLHPATDCWMRGDKFGMIQSVSRRSRSFLDPRDPRNGKTFMVLLDASGRRMRVAEGNILEIFD